MNDTDLRDERLGELLDRAVRDLDPEPASRPEYRHGRSRAVRITAAVATAAVFIGVAAWASSQVSRDGRTSVRYGSLETEGWSLATPASWIGTPFRPCEVNRLLRTGVIVSDVDFAFRDPQGGDPSCEDRFVFEGFPEGGVA
ncbi:MAG: hypothetical protein ACXWXS_11315, partial [Actinomycetota bacterium]